MYQSKFFNKPPSWLLACAAISVLAACDNGYDDNNLTGTPRAILADEDPGQIVIVPPAAVESQAVNVVVRDTSNAILTEATVFVVDDASLGDLVEDNQETIIAPNGFARIPVSNVTEDSIIRLEVIKEGFVRSGGRYNLTPNEDLDVEIVLTAEDADEEGIRTSQASADLSQGNIIVEATDQEDTQQALTTVEIPQDLEIFDVEGNELNDELVVNVTYFDPSDSDALSAFPGGFTAAIENPEDVNVPSIENTFVDQTDDDLGEVEVSFQTVGFASVEIFDSNGLKADQFNGTIEVTIIIQPNSTNPQTGQPIVAGDAIPVWSFDTDTAKWEYESVETVTLNANGQLQVSFQADHLSYWSAAFYTRSQCNVLFSTRITDNTGLETSPDLIDVFLFGAYGGNRGYRQRIPVRFFAGSVDLNANQRLFVYVPRSLVTFFEFNALEGINIDQVSVNGTPYGSGQSIPLCNNGEGATLVSINVSVSSSIPEEPFPVLSDFSHSVTALANCEVLSNPGEFVSVPLAGTNVIFFNSVTGQPVSATTNSDGVATFTGTVLGTSEGSITGTYTYFNSSGQQVSDNNPTTITIADNTTNNNLIFNDIACTTLTGAVTFN